MNSPTRSLYSPTNSRVGNIIPETTILSPRTTISNRNELEMNIHSLQNEQERVQKKTFTKWMNIYLSMHEPPYFITDLFEDLKDGSRLIGLLEVLSGQTIPIEKGNKRAHFISNVSNALKFLESRKIKLVNIRPPDIVDGRSTIILGLIWMLILCYQIEDSSMIDEDSNNTRSKAKEALLTWVQKKTSGKIEGLDVRDFTSSWRDGLAFNALIHSIRPELIDLHRISRMDVRERLEYAFKIAEEQLGIPRLIDVEDVCVSKPDEKSIMTYLAQFSRRYPDLPFGSINKEHGELLRWLADARQRLMLFIEAPINDIQAEYKEFIKQTKEFIEKQKQWKAFERKESKNPHFPGEKLQELKQAFDEIAARMNQWRFKLDSNLPGDLRQIVEWIYRAEENLARGIPFQSSNYSAEENYQRFKQLLDEHQVIFTDKEITQTRFQRLKREPNLLNGQIAPEHIANLDERLQLIMTNSEERGRQFDYEQSRWQMQTHLDQLDDLFKSLNRKQGDHDETEQLIGLLRKKLQQDRLIQNIETLLPDLIRKAQSYNQLNKKDDRFAKEALAFSEGIRQRLKSIGREFESKEKLLQMTLESWRIYHDLFDQLERWLSEGEQILRRPLAEEKLQHFSSIDHWTDIHRKVGQSIEYLMSVCDDELVTQLQNRLLYINRRWKEITDDFQRFKHDELIRKKRDEFYSGRTNTIETLEKILQEIQQNLPCSPKALKEQENRLIGAQATLPTLQRTIQVLIELSQRIAHDSGEANIAKEMKSSLDTCANLYQQVEKTLPLILNRNKAILGQLQRFDEAVQKCHLWFNEAKQLFNRYSISVPVKRIEEYLEQNRNFVAQMELYRPIVENLGRLVESMKRTNDQTASLNFSSIDEQCRQVIDHFQEIERQATHWDHLFTQHCQLWNDFHHRQESLEEWIDRAQTIVNERSEDFDGLIRRHRDFFQHIDDEILHGFIKSGQELLHIRDPIERNGIEYLMKTLESKWNTITCFAPIRLLRLQYERMENLIVQELKQADEELNDELKELERQRDTTELLRRHEKHFQMNNFQPKVDGQMRDLETFADDIRLKERGQTLVRHENEQIDRRTNDLNGYWAKMQKKIDDVKRKLQTIPKKWKEFEERFHQVESWMNNVERSIQESQNVDLPLEQYRRIVDKFRSDAQQTESMSDNVKSIGTILEDLINEGATNEAGRYQQRLDTLVTRYRQTLQSIEETSQRCSVIIPSKLLHENSSKLIEQLTRMQNISNSCRDLSEVHSALNQQNRFCETLKDLQNEIRDVLNQGNELSRQPMVPKYVQQDLQTLQKLYQEKVQSSQEMLTKLKRLLELWERFDGNQRRYQQNRDRIAQDLKQMISNRQAINSYSQEIDRVKNLQNSSGELKTILDELAQLMQTIGTNQLLPYENLPILKSQFDRNQEEFHELHRMINEYIQELKKDQDKWNLFNDELIRLENFFRQIHSIIESKTFNDQSLEEKQEKIERLRIELNNHLASLSSLLNDGSNLSSLRSHPKDLQTILNRLHQLKDLAEETKTKVHRQEENVSECRTHVQITQKYLEELHPWIDQSEIYLQKRDQQRGASNLNEAKQILDRHKEFIEDRRRMLTIYENLIKEDGALVNERELKSFIKSLSTRWNDVLRRSDKLTSQIDEQYQVWFLFESEMSSFRDQILPQLEQRFHSLTTLDWNKFLDLNRINTNLNDLKKFEKDLNEQTSYYNRLLKQMNDLRPFASADGQRYLHDEQKTLETRWRQLQRVLQEKLNESDRLYQSRNVFHHRFEEFQEVVRALSEDVENQGQIPTNKTKEILQILQQIQKQFSNLQPLITTIGHDLAELEATGLPRLELQPIQNTFETQCQRLQTYETILQKRIDLLKRFDEHLKRSTEMRTKLQQINDDLQTRQQTLKLNEIDQMKTQLERFHQDLRTIQSESSVLDRLMEESNTTITDSTTHRTLFFTVESRSIQNLLDMIENKLIQRRSQTEELNQSVEEFTQAHNNLLQRLNNLSQKIRSTRLQGYTIRDIDQLMEIIKNFNRELHTEETHFNTLRGKFNGLAPDLHPQERQQIEAMLTRAESELEQLFGQVNERKERLHHLTQRQQELNQVSERLRIWCEEKRRYLSSDQMIPLKISEIERAQKKYQDTLNELKYQRVSFDSIVKLSEEVKQGYSREGQSNVDLHMDELLRQLNDLEQRIDERQRIFDVASDHRRDWDQILSKLQDWIKSSEQQIKDPLNNDLQQPGHLLKEKSHQVQILLQSARDRTSEFDDLSRIYKLIASNLNETDRISLDEKLSVVKDRYNRLIDNLDQRVKSLDEANRERDLLDEQVEQVQNLYRQLQIDLTKFKQGSISTDGNHPDDGLSNQQRLEQYQQLMRRIDDLNSQSKALSSSHRLLTSKGHRIDFRPAGELNLNIKNLEGQIHHEIERVERNLQTEKDFSQLEKDLDVYLQQSSEQFRAAHQHPDKAIAFQNIAERIQQGEMELQKLIQLAERLKPELPRAQYEQLQRTIQQRQEYLQNLSKSCQQARGEHEQMIATQTKLVEELISIHEWLKRLLNDLTQGLELNFSLNHLHDLQDMITQWETSIDQRMARLDQALREELTPVNSNDQEIRDRLKTVESLRQEVKIQLNKRRSLLEDIHHRMSQYNRLTTEVKTAICDADFKLAPFFDGYDRNRLDEHERELNNLMEICREQTKRLIEAEKFIESIRTHLKVNARELCDNQLRNFRQTIEDLETRVQQRRKELEEIRQKNNRFHSSRMHLQSDTNRLLNMIERSPDNADALVTEIDSTLSALQYLGRDLKRSLDVSSSSDIDRELKDMASSVESVRDSLDRAKKSYEENEVLRDRIERAFTHVKSFINRKRQELTDSVDSGYGSIDLSRKSVEMKNFLRDVELETGRISDVSELISNLADRRCDPQIIQGLKKKQQDALNDLQNLRSETTKAMGRLDEQIQEQENLRQHARTVLSLIQRIKVQLIELRPTMTDDASQTLQRIDDDWKSNAELFEQAVDNYRRDFGNVSEDLDKMIGRIIEDTTEIRGRLDEKEAELHAYNVIRDEYQTNMENFLQAIQLIERKADQSRGVNFRENLDLFKELAEEMQIHRSSLDRLQLLSSTITSQLTDVHERDQVRQRLNEITRRWTQLEQDLITEEETMEEMKTLSETTEQLQISIDHWLRQTRDLVHELSNAKQVELFDQLIPRGKTILYEYQTFFEQLQRLRNRFNRLTQTNKTPEATQKLIEIDRLATELSTHHDNLSQRLDLSQKIHFQLNEFNKQNAFYEQWIENSQRTANLIPEQTLTIDEKLQRYHDLQIELDKRRQVIQTLTHEYPQIAQQITPTIQQLLSNIERIKVNVTRKQDEYDQQNRLQKDFRGRIDSLFEWLKQTHRYEPLSDKRDLDSLQREHKKLTDKRQQIDEKFQEIDNLSRLITTSNLPADSLQRLRDELDHLQSRFKESIVELDTRTTFMQKTIKDVDEQQRKNRSYQESLNKLSSLVQHELQTPGRSIEDALRALDEQMLRFENESEEKERRKRQREREWHLFMDEITLLQEKLNTFKQRKINGQDSIEEQLHFIRNQDEELDQYQDDLTHLKQHGQSMCLEEGNAMPLPSELQLLQSMIVFLKEQFEQRRQQLIQSARCRDFYLNECKLYDDAYNLTLERLNRSIAVASTSDQYAQQFHEQRMHSEQMDEKRRQLNLLYDRLDHETRTRYGKQHQELEKRSNDLQDRLTAQIIRMEYYLRIWREYQVRLDDIRHQLDDIQKELPLTKRLLHFEQIQAAAVLYKDLNQRLVRIEPELLHLNDEIQALSQDLNVISLQNDIANVKENFLRLINEIREKFENHKSASIIANDIKRHMSNFDEILNQCATESRTRYDGNANELKLQLERMMDVEKRLDNAADVHSNAMTSLKRLATFNLYDLQSTESALENLQRKWTTLKTDILRHETVLHQNIINSLPSRQACKEMMLFIETIKRLLDDDHGAPVNNREVLQRLLKRYRDMRVEVLNHQMTIDYLNESFQTEANVDLTSIDYMEKIKQINIDWIRIKSLISARIDTLEQLNDQFNEFDQTVRTLSDWVQEQTSDLEFMRTRNLESGAKDNIRRCNDIEYQLTSKQQILTSLKSYSHRMSSLSSTFHIVDQEGTIQNLRHMLDHLSPSIEQLKSKSKSILVDWQDYNRLLLQMEKILREAEGELDRIETSAMNVETYEMSTRKAQEHLQLMETHRRQFDQIHSQGRQLSGQCDGQTSLKINEITQRIQQQWTLVEQRLHTMIEPSREVVEHWRIFNTSYVYLLDRLGELETRWYTIQRDKFNTDIESLLEKAKDFQQRLQEIDHEITKLHDHAQKLGEHLPSIAGKKIDTQYAVVKNHYTELRTYQDRLMIDCTELKHREKIFLEYLNELMQTIRRAQQTYENQHLSDENESMNIKQLQESIGLLQSKQDLIERLNSQEFILYFKRAKDLHEVLVEYSHTIELLQNRQKQLEISLFNRSNFDKRCQRWNEYIQAIEQNLHVIDEHIQTNYQGLLEIDTNLSNTINDFNQRQQELIQLITEGKQLIEQKSIIDQNTFTKLEQRWQTIVRTVYQKQEQVKDLIKLWLSYQNYLETYYRLLKKRYENEQEQLQSPTVMIINQLKQGTYLNSTQNEDIQHLLEKIYETNRRLMSFSDPKTQTILEKEWNDLQKSAKDIDIHLNQRSEILITLLLRYNEVERTLDEINLLIKSIRTLQQQHQSNDDLDQFIQQCQNKDRELTQHRHELHRLRQVITEMSADLHPDDTRQLMQKLNLIEIQWNDAERALTTLIDSLSKKRTEFNDFEHKYQRLNDWFEHFLKVELNHRIDGLTLEASLDILKNEIRNLLADKRRHVNELLIAARVFQSQNSDQGQLHIVKQHSEQLEEILNKSEEQVERRIRKTEMIVKMLTDFEQGLESTRIWMDTVETNLQRPLALNILNANDLRNQQQTLLAIETDIDQHSTVVSNLLALGHNLLNESDVRPRNIDSIPRTIHSVEQRWVLLKDLLRKRKLELETIPLSWKNLEEAIQSALKMITDHERFLSEVKRTSGQGLQGIRSEYKTLENFQRTLNDDDKEIQQITNNYSEIVRAHPAADTRGELRTKIKDLTTRWETLINTVQETLKNLKYMLSVHGDFQLTQDSLALWLTDLDVLLTNLEHLSEASSNEKIRQLDDMDREIQEKQSKIEYVRTCANYLLSKTVDARGLSINMNELTKFCQQLRDLTKRITKLKQKLMNTSITSVRSSSPLHESLRSLTSSPVPSRSRSPQRLLRSRDRFLRSYGHIEWGDRYQRAQELLADFEDILLQINGDFLSKDETFQSPVPSGVHIETLPNEFNYNRMLSGTRRKIEALRDAIKQIDQELGIYLMDDLNNDPAVLEIMDKWVQLQSSAYEKDEKLKENRRQWKQFKRELEDLEQSAQYLNTMEFNTVPRTVYSKADVHRDQVQRLDELQSLLKSVMSLADQFSDDSSEWLLIEHRLQNIRDHFQFLFAKTNREHRELRTNLVQTEDLQHAMLEINAEFDHLEALTHSLEPVDEYETNAGINRTKLHRFIRIHDDLEILNERLLNISDRSSTLLAGDQLRVNNDLKLMLDRLNSIKRIVRIYLDRLEKLLARNELRESFSSRSQSPVRRSPSNLQRVYQ